LRALRLMAAPADVPRSEFAKLAAKFPGVLRELDRLPLSVIEQRLLALDAVLAGEAELAPWMTLQIAYHGFMRAALRIRRSLRRQIASDAASGTLETLLEHSGYAPASDEPALARFDAHTLATLLKPPHGRLNPWVMQQVARDHGVTAQAVELALLAGAIGT
jgi:hypothetical protein